MADRPPRVPPPSLPLPNRGRSGVMTSFRTKPGRLRGPRAGGCDGRQWQQQQQGSAEGKVVLIPRIDLSPSDTGLPFKLIQRQFPMMPAFAMTINKSQRQTLDKVGIFLPEPVFRHGGVANLQTTPGPSLRPPHAPRGPPP
ncbi:hypothetical protein QTO34_008324 [Cnephaeus nilssonii]|uniref:ATP-dependent DNA helicase n=1 Tax=Cnephaeus nilssonii TaxID=3371016 RepID=A0AA40IA32_CNENI|nr:hypothetical protein QTO34_008324 [Eptesicus nilssonii]